MGAQSNTSLCAWVLSGALQGLVKVVRAVLWTGLLSSARSHSA